MPPKNFRYIYSFFDVLIHTAINKLEGTFKISICYVIIAAYYLHLRWPNIKFYFLSFMNLEAVETKVFNELYSFYMEKYAAVKSDMIIYMPVASAIAIGRVHKQDGLQIQSWVLNNFKGFMNCMKDNEKRDWAHLRYT